VTRRQQLVALLALTSAALVAAAASAAVSPRPSTVTLLLAAAFLPYAGVVALADALDRRTAMRTALVLALALGAALVLAPPLLSDDVYRYLWDARVLGAGVDPYRYAPDHPALAPLRDALWRRVNNPEIPTIYPPIAQLYFFVADRIAHAPWSVKALALLGHLAITPVVARLAGDDRAPRAALAWALNPLALSEAALGGHVDVLAGLLVALTVLALVRGRPWVAAVACALTSGVKLVGLALAPLVGLRDRRAAVLALVLAALPLVVLARAGQGGDAVSGLGQYARRWRGNEGAFALVDGALRAGLDVVGPWTGAGPRHIRLGVLAPLLRAAAGTPLDPRLTLAAEKKEVPDPLDFQTVYVAGLAARALVVLAVFALAIALARRGTAPLLAARWVLLLGLLFAPQAHPWYLLWLLPLEVALGRPTALVWSVLVLLAYAPLDGWLQTRIWAESGAVRAFEHAAVWAVLGVETRAWARFSGLWRRKDPTPAP